MRRLTVLLVLLSSIIAQAGRPIEPTSPLDFTISAPGSWVGPVGVVNAGGGKKLEEADVKAVLSGSRPAALFFRYPSKERAADNPSVKVLITEAPRTTPAELLALFRDVQRKLFADYKVVEEIHDTRLNGLPAATLAATFTNQGFPTAGRVWVLQRDQFLYILGTAGPVDPPADLQKDFDQIVSSFRFKAPKKP